MLITKIFNNTISSFLTNWQIEKEQTIWYLYQEEKKRIQNVRWNREIKMREQKGRAAARTLGLLGPPWGHGIGLRSWHTHLHAQKQPQTAAIRTRSNFKIVIGNCIFTRPQAERSWPDRSRGLYRPDRGGFRLSLVARRVRQAGGRTVPIPGLLSLEWRGHDYPSLKAVAASNKLIITTSR